MPIQNVVDVLQELLHDNLRVGEQEHRILVLHARLLVQDLQVVVERLVVVAAAQLNLEALVATDVTGQPGQRLLASAANTDKQGIAPVLSDDAADARDVLHGVHEEDHLHLLVVLQVEVLLVVGEDALQLVVLRDVLVESVLFGGAHFHEVAENDRLLTEQLGLDLLAKVLAGALGEHAVQQSLVLVIDESVVEDALDLRGS